MASDLLRVFAIGSPVIFYPLGGNQQFSAKIVGMTLFESDLTERVEYSVHLQHSNTTNAAKPSELTAIPETIYSRIFTP